MKKLDRDGVLVLFDLCHEPSMRYKRCAGISVGVTLGTGVYIDAVGQGFDGREVTKGLARHERFVIPWFELRRCCIENSKEYRTWLISEPEYLISRYERIQFLSGLKLYGIEVPLEVALDKVPEQYEEISDFIWLDVIQNVIKKLEKIEDILKNTHLHEFSITGHTEGKRFLPWQLSDDSRYQFQKKLNN